MHGWDFSIITTMKPGAVTGRPPAPLSKTAGMQKWRFLLGICFLTVAMGFLGASISIGARRACRKGVIGVMLPGTPFSLMMKDYAPARKIIDFGVPVALATDLNPNCWIENMQFIIQLACLNMKMTPAEAITASTFNSACAIGLNDTVGSLEKGKQADIIILDIPSYRKLPYHSEYYLSYFIYYLLLY